MNTQTQRTPYPVPVYRVKCTDESGERVYATSRLFDSHQDAETYAYTVATSRNPEVVQEWTRHIPTTQFTPGPWEGWESSNGDDDPAQFRIDAENGLVVAWCDGEDDARLIAAAPELYEALRMMLEAFPVPKIRAANGMSGNLAHAAARAALAKVTL